MTTDPTPDTAALTARIAAKKAEPPFRAFAEALAQTEEAGPADVLADAVDLLREAATLYDAREQPDSAALLRRLARELTAAPVSSAVPDHTLRDRVAAVLAEADGWKWAPGHKATSPTWRGYQERADAVLSVLPRPAPRAAVLYEAAAAAASGDVEFNTEAISAAAANAGPFALVAYVQLAVSEHLRRLAAEAQPETERPRCPHCQLRHDLDPDSTAVHACQSIRAEIADARRRHGEGDHGGCAAVDCEVVRAIRNDAPAAGVRQPDTETHEAEAHPPTHTWKVESPRRDKWASWGATHDERVWAAASYEDVIEVAPQRAFRLVRATTTYVVEAEHTPTPDTAGRPVADDSGEETDRG